jgi:hypothetical protein
VDPDPQHWTKESLIPCSGEAGNSAPRPQVQEHPRQAGPLLRHCRPRSLCQVRYRSTYRKQFADPGSGAFLTLDPGSGIGFFSIPDPGSQTHIFHGLMANFGG